MALDKYVAQTPPERNQRLYLANEFRRVEISISSLVALLNALEIPIEIGPADSGGAGYRVLRIPN